ncbi:MAG: O-methyltransferase [Sedimentisphaerales bacterium]|nr:O-methyltransferase [Sedimentisphaerales bacterium]
MYKKVMAGILLAVLLITTAYLMAQDNTGQRDAQGRRGFRQRFGTWLEDIDKAYQANDWDKMGQLIEQMKQDSQRMREAGPPGADRGARVRPQIAAPAETDPVQTKSVVPASEQTIMMVLDDMFQNQRRSMMNVPPEDGKVLRLLTEALGAKTVVEIGTSNGYSGIWFCLALQKTGGRLITHDIDEGRASLARENFKKAGVDNLVTLVMGDAHETILKLEGPIDILFLDADKDGYLDYLNKLLPKVRPGGLILSHNTSMRGQMADFINAITTNPALETVFIHQDAQGLGITLKKR